MSSGAVVVAAEVAPLPATSESTTEPDTSPLPPFCSVVPTVLVRLSLLQATDNKTKRIPVSVTNLMGYFASAKKKGGLTNSLIDTRRPRDGVVSRRRLSRDGLPYRRPKSSRIGCPDVCIPVPQACATSRNLSAIRFNSFGVSLAQAATGRLAVNVMKLVVAAKTGFQGRFQESLRGSVEI